MASTAQQTFSGPTPPFKLFDSNSVGLATLIGGPVAGSLLMAINYRRLGFMGKAIAALVIGAIVTGLAIMIGWNIPDERDFSACVGAVVCNKVVGSVSTGPNREIPS